MHDLVELGGVADIAPQVGVVVGLLGARELRVMLQTGREVTVLPSSLRGKVAPGRSSSAQDSAGTTLAAEDVVRVIIGDAKDSVGTIKHIHKGHLFLHNFARPASAGIFVARAARVMLASTRVEKRPDAAPQVIGGRSGGGGVGRGGPPRDSNIGKTAQIRKGDYSGKLGVIRVVTDTHYSIELHQAQAKRAVVAKVSEGGG